MKPILVVEDSADDLLFLQRTIGQIGLENPLHIVRDGEQAVDYLQKILINTDRQRFPLPALVLLDLRLPLMSGLEVLKWIRQQELFQTLIVIILSTSSLDSDVALAYRLGANSYLVKTSSSEQLRKMIHVVKEYWLELNKTSG